MQVLRRVRFNAVLGYSFRKSLDQILTQCNHQIEGNNLSKKPGPDVFYLTLAESSRELL